MLGYSRARVKYKTVLVILTGEGEVHNGAGDTHE